MTWFNRVQANLISIESQCLWVIYCLSVASPVPTPLGWSTHLILNQPVLVAALSSLLQAYFSGWYMLLYKLWFHLVVQGHTQPGASCPWQQQCQGPRGIFKTHSVIRRSGPDIHLSTYWKQVLSQGGWLGDTQKRPTHFRWLVGKSEHADTGKCTPHRKAPEPQGIWTWNSLTVRWRHSPPPCCPGGVICSVCFLLALGDMVD